MSSFYPFRNLSGYVESPYQRNGLEYESGGERIMLKIIRRVLRLSGDLSKRIWGCFICGFLESIFGLLPIAAVFIVFSGIAGRLSDHRPTWGIVVGLIAGGLLLRILFKYLVYRLQSTAGFEFVAGERIALGDRLWNADGLFPR